MTACSGVSPTVKTLKWWHCKRRGWRAKPFITHGSLAASWYQSGSRPGGGHGGATTAARRACAASAAATPSAAVPSASSAEVLL